MYVMTQITIKADHWVKVKLSLIFICFSFHNQNYMNIL